VSRLAIVIPYMGDSASLESTLASVLAHRPRACEVVVALARPYSDPYDIKSEVRFVAAAAGEGLAGAVNAGVRQSTAPVVHLLWCGAEVSEGWSDPAMTHLRDSRVVAVAPVVVDAHEPARIVAAGVTYHVGGAILPLAAGEAVDSVGTRCQRVLAPHPVAAFYRRSTLETIGGLSTTVGDALAGIDAGLTFRQLGWTTLMEPRCRVSVPGGSAWGLGRFRQALEAERFFWQWAAVLGPVRSVACHGMLVAGEGVRGVLDLSIVPRLAGRLVGGCLAVSSPGRRQRISELRARLGDPAPLAPTPAPHFPPSTSRARGNGQAVRPDGSAR